MDRSTGVLVLIVGASGVGKDTLIAGAKTALAGDPRFSFVRRIVTRPADAALEDHDTVDAETFSKLEAAGNLALHWDAHGLRYGLPIGVLADLGQGKIAVANGSRHAIALARSTFSATSVILITADLALRAERLARRGREDGSQIASRLARETAPRLDGAVSVTIDNSGNPEDGTAQLVAALRAIADKTSG